MASNDPQRSNRPGRPLSPGRLISGNPVRAKDKEYDKQRRDVIDHLVILETQRYIREKKNTLEGQFRKATDREMIHVLATHLACTPQFLDWCENPGQIEDVSLTKHWMASVYVRGRFTDQARSYSYWERGWYKEHKLDIVEEAQDIVKEATNVGRSRLEKTQAPLPENSAKTRSSREQLFKIHITRQNLISQIHDATELQFNLGKELREIVSSDAKQTKERVDRVVAGLIACEKAKRDMNKLLQYGPTTEQVLAFLDTQLAKLPRDANHGILCVVPVVTTQTIPASQMSDDLFASQSESQAASSTTKRKTWPTPKQVAMSKAICEKFRITLSYLDNRQQNFHDFGDKELESVMVARRKTDDFTDIQKSDPIEPPLTLTYEQWGDAEDATDAWLNDHIDSEVHAEAERKFELNFRAFEAVVQRPELCSDALPKAQMFRWLRWTQLEVLKDDLYHVRRLAADLLTQDMVKRGKDGKVMKAHFQSTLRRMWALVALLFGCTSEPGLFCLAMDKLITNLANLVIGHTDILMETTTMEQVMLAMLKKPIAERMSSKFLTPIENFSKESKAREIVSELARFYRGAVSLAVSYTAPESRNEPVNRETWLRDLLRFAGSCGEPFCQDEIKLDVMPWGAHLNSDMDAVGDEDEPEADADNAQVPEKLKFSVSIAMKDARVGLPMQRQHISSNRLDNYTCMSSWIGNLRYTVAMGVFFHYFSHMWHPSCRPWRGKQRLTEGMDDAAETEEMLSQSNYGDTAAAAMEG